MLVLVTQADGSARRLTFLTFALAILLVASFMSEGSGGGSAQRAIELRVELLDYFDEHPYVEIQDSQRALLPASYTDPMREAFFDERRSQGLPLISKHIIRRAQEEFDDLLIDYDLEIAKLPAWRYGISAEGSPAANYFFHIGVHETRAILLITLMFFFFAAIPLEDGWGPILFGLFCAGAIFLTATMSVATGYEARMGMPWTGASGLVAACLGASFVRSLRGSPRLFGMIPLPGLVLVPLWIGFEYVSIREMTSSDTFVREVAMVHGAGFVLGFLVSTVLMVLGFERRMIAREVETEELVSNPVLDQAMQAREEGRNDVAFELLKREYRKSNRDPDVALAFWDVAQFVDRAHVALEAILMVIRSDLKEGVAARAVRNYFLATDAVGDLKLEPEINVRLGEALLDEGHPQDALKVLERAVQSSRGLSTALAQRVVRVARDLDPDLTQRAAAVALKDPKLDAGERARLVELSGEVVAETPAVQAAPVVRQKKSTERALPEVRPASAPRPAEALPPVAPAASAEPAVDPGALDGAESEMGPALELDEDDSLEEPRWDDDVDLDPGALSLDALTSDVATEDDAGSDDPDAWNDPGLLEELGSEMTGEPDEFGDLGDLGDLDPGELEQAALDAGLLDGAGQESGSSTDTIPLDIIEAGETVTVGGSSDDTAATPTSVNVPAEVRAEARDEVQGQSQSLTQPSPVATGSSDEASAAELRPLRVRTAIPLRLEDRALVVEVDEGGKTRLPLDRVEAVSAAAIHGIADKPVLIVDVVLNWQTAGEPLKLIRLRSDRFDPCNLVPEAGSPLDALRGFISALLDRSNAAPLPNREAATGAPFGSYGDLAGYQAEVLFARE